MKTFLESRINWITALVSLAIFILFMILVLPRVSTYAEENIGGIGSPDTDMMLTGQELYDIAESYGEEGRDTYVFLRWTFDLVWPLVYTFFLLSFIIVLGKNLPYKFVRPMYLLPLVAMLMDYLENTLVTIVMVAFPRKLLTIGSIASFSSLLKWGTLSLAFLFVFILAVTRLVWKFRIRG